MKRLSWVGICVALLALSGCAFFNFGPKTLYHETFSGETVSQWWVGEDAERHVWVEDGRYHVKIKTDAFWWTQTRNTSQGPFDDFRLEADVLHIAGTSNRTFAGIVFRAVDGSNLYSFEVAASGHFRVRKREGGNMSSLVAWTSSEAITKGVATNRLAVEASGQSLTFFINGTQVESLTDGSFASGHIGVRADTPGENPGMHVAFDNILVTTLK